MRDQRRQRRHPAPLKLIGLGLGLLSCPGPAHQVDLNMVAQTLAAALEIGCAHFSHGDYAKTDHLREVIQHCLFYEGQIVFGFTGNGRHGQRRPGSALHTPFDTRHQLVHAGGLLGCERPGYPVNLYFL